MCKLANLQIYNHYINFVCNFSCILRSLNEIDKADRGRPLQTEVKENTFLPLSDARAYFREHFQHDTHSRFLDSFWVDYLSQK